MSSYLWRYYLENDAESFQRLLQGTQPSGHSSSRRHMSNKTGLGNGSSPGVSKPITGNLSRSHPGLPPVGFTITKQMLRELDGMGRSLLHVACSNIEKILFVKALLSHSLSDPGQVDMESGWTSLHRALYNGNVSATREIMSANPINWNLVEVKDNSGDTPFDVFGASIYDVESLIERDLCAVDDTVDQSEELGIDEQTHLKSSTRTLGDEVFTWGSNKNLALGFSDGDDRSYPERVSLKRPRPLLLELAKKKQPGAETKPPEDLLDARTLFSGIAIADVCLSKFHTAVLTTDPHSNLFICGYGHGGRLGFGEEQNTQFKLKPLSPPLLPKKRVQAVALGLDHTVVVMENGDVWAWGSNKWGQLGYVTQQKHPKEEPIQPTPRQVFGLLKKEPVLGCAASKTHTAVFTSDSLYTFGKNDGQLGILDASDSKTLTSQTLPRRVSASFLLKNRVIQQVAAVDKATAILVNSSEVFVFARYGYSKLSPPGSRISTYTIDLPGTRARTNSGHIRKIAAGGDTICTLSTSGNVFAVDVEATLKNRAERGSGKMNWVIQRAWSMRKKHMEIEDLDIGVDGGIIFCTKDGSVWKQVKRVKAKEGGGDNAKYKFDRVPGLTRITAVRSSTTGTFAAIRKDADLMRKGLPIGQPELWGDVSQMLSFGGIFGSDEDNKTPTEGNEEEWGYEPKPKPAGFGNAVNWFMQENIADDLREHLREAELEQGFDGWDMTVCTTNFNEIEVPVHSVILSRSPVLRKLMSNGSGKIEDTLEITKTKEGKLKLTLKNFELLTMLNVVYYLYIDTVIDLWHQRSAKKGQAAYFKTLRTELLSLASALGLEPLFVAVSRMHYPQRTMHHDLRSAFVDPGFFKTTDMIIDLAEGESMKVHSALMRVRCPFFSTLYGGGMSDRWLVGRQEEEDDYVHVDMTHVTREIMQMIVSWLYYDWDEEGFDGIRVGVDEEDIDIFLDFVLDVLSVANELILGRLGRVCQRVIGWNVNTRNAAGLLNAIAECSEKGFKEGCLQYICLNIETMLENHLIDELDEGLMSDLDVTVRKNQSRCYPCSRSGRQETRLLEKYPTMIEDSAREQASLLAYHIEITEESSLSSSLKASSFPPDSSSPSINFSAKRKHSKMPFGPPASPSPLIRPSLGGDDIFSMDDEELPPLSGQSSQVRTGPWKLKGPIPAAQSSPVASPSTQKESFLASTPPGTSQGAAPWSTPTPVKSTKLDMKEIMSQASIVASGKSALTAQLAASPIAKPETTPVRLSQKERKRQQQQQQQQQQHSGPSRATPEKKAAWNVDPSVQAPKVSLKDVLSSSAPKSVAATPPTPISSRRTISSTHSPLPTTFTPTSAAIAGPSKSRLSPPLPAPSEAMLRLSLQDIIDQEEAQKELVKEYGAKRSLQEIQEEQEFLRWWEDESKRVQIEEAKASEKNPRGNEGGQRGGRGDRGRGRGGGKGRGRGRGGGSGGERGGKIEGDGDRGGAPKPTGEAAPTQKPKRDRPKDERPRGGGGARGGKVQEKK